MQNNFLITVTNNIEGRNIEDYIDTICTNVVLGTNIFSDFKASLSDIFGGFSGSYRNKLELIYEEAKKELKKKAQSIGANAIVGFTVDFDEISGGGKSMFMISASGTACKIKDLPQDKKQENLNENVSYEIFDIELKKYQVKKKLKNNLYLKNEETQFLMGHMMTEIVDDLLVKYIKINEDIYDREFTPEIATNNQSFITDYIKSVPAEYVLDKVYEIYKDDQDLLKHFVYSCNLFSPKHIFEIAQNDIHFALDLLDAPKRYYNNEDIAYLRDLLDIFDSLPNTGERIVLKGGLLRKEEEKFLCQCKHANDKEVLFCGRCGVNIKGLNKTEVQTIDTLRDKLEVLSLLLKA